MEGSNKISTGVLGIDEILNGGIPEGSQVLLIGDTGTAKSLFALTTAYKNAESGSSVAYLALDESKDSIIKNIKIVFPSFANIDGIIKNNKIFIVEKETVLAIKASDVIERFLVILENAVKVNDSKLLVIDSLGALRANLNDDRTFTNALAMITDYLRKINVTSIIVSETAPRSGGKVAGLYDEAMFDGIIKLGKRNEDGKTNYRASIVKMRYSSYKDVPIQFEITSNGVASKKPQAGL